MKKISNIRWSNEFGKVLFDYNGKTVAIKEPADITLKNDNASMDWIWRNYKSVLIWGSRKDR